MRRTAMNQPQPRGCGAGALAALAITMLVTPVLAQDADPVTDDAAPEAPPPPLPSVPPPTPINPAAPPALAPIPDPADQRERPEELIVTGSRVRRADLNAPAPVTTLDRQRIEAAGRGSIGEIIQQLPSQSNAINTQFNNGGDGRTNVNLRGLDANRTLVLLNGRRFVPGGTGADSSVDLNAIPLSIIERIEVLKDGASAVYGSDAIGGVVNIITRRDLSGVEASLYNGAGQHGGVIYQVSATAGEVTDKAALLFAFEYYNQGTLFAGARDFSSVDKAFNFPTFEESTRGSSAVPQGHIIGGKSNLPGNAAWRALTKGRRPIAHDFYNDPNDGWRPYNPSGTSDSGEGDQYNYQPENYILTPQERYNIFTLGHYDILPNVRGYFEGSYTNRRSNQLLATTPLFTTNEDITVSGQNIYDPFGRDFDDVRRRMVEAGNRRFLQDIDTFRAVLGFDGGLPEGLGVLSEWRWDAHFIYGRTEGTEINRGRFVRSRVENALGPSFTDNETGEAKCGTPGDVISDCVPLDLFGGVGSVTPEMLAYISYDGTQRGFSEQQIWGADLNGPLFSLLDNPVGLALGYQHRREAGASLPDPITASGDTTGNKAEPTAGGFSVNAAYAELGLPLAVGVPGLEMLELNAAARWVDFSSFGSQLTWKLGARWQLLEHIAFRGTASRSFRAPSIGELFGGQADSFPTVSDPCDESGTLDATIRANCIAEGIITEDPNDRFIDEQTQLRAQVGGNENLEPETADTFTAGVVITPKFGKWTEGLSITVDYFNINIVNAIQPIGANVILSNCYEETVRQNCDLIQRNPTTKLITNIFNFETNIGETQTAGIDFGIVYRIPTEIGRFGLNYNATWLERYDETQGNGKVVNGAGVYDLGAFPRLRFNAGLTYGFENFGAGLNLNYVGPFRECENRNCRPDEKGRVPLSRNIESWVGTDLYASYRISSPLGVTSLSAGINNLADAEPPAIYEGSQSNSDAATYDYLGRYFYFRLTQVF